MLPNNGCRVSIIVGAMVFPFLTEPAAHIADAVVQLFNQHSTAVNTEHRLSDTPMFTGRIKRPVSIIKPSHQFLIALTGADKQGFQRAAAGWINHFGAVVFPFFDNPTGHIARHVAHVFELALFAIGFKQGHGGASVHAVFAHALHDVGFHQKLRWIAGLKMRRVHKRFLSKRVFGNQLPFAAFFGVTHRCRGRNTAAQSQ